MLGFVWPFVIPCVSRTSASQSCLVFVFFLLLLVSVLLCWSHRQSPIALLTTNLSICSCVGGSTPLAGGTSTSPSYLVSCVSDPPTLPSSLPISPTSFLQLHLAPSPLSCHLQCHWYHCWGLQDPALLDLAPCHSQAVPFCKGCRCCLHPIRAALCWDRGCWR